MFNLKEENFRVQGFKDSDNFVKKKKKGWTRFLEERDNE